MGPDFPSDICFTCFSKPVHFLKISDSDGDPNPNIRHIICQHFWFQEDDLRSAIVCETCWEKVDQFHTFYLDVKKLHEQREVDPLSMIIKQEEFTFEVTQLQENFLPISAENQKIIDTADCKPEITEERVELQKKEEPAEVCPQPRKLKKRARRLPDRRVAKGKNLRLHKPLTPEERQAEDDLIKQHTRFFCDECSIEFENFREIRLHQVKVHKKDFFLCCGKQHSSRARLYQHVQSFLNPEAFKCDICGKTFQTKSNYVRHKELYHAAEDDLVFKCNRCSKSFIKEGLLKSHLAEHETLENEKAKCEFCGKCFRNNYIFKRHIRLSHKKPMDFICEVCSKGFYLKERFLEHHKTHVFTAEQLKEQCPVCNKWFKNHINLVHHVRRHKRGECTCEVCDHVSINITSLKKSSDAADRNRHVCEQCGQECSGAVNLKEHVAYAHSREPLYQCQYCEKKFFFSGTLRSHIKKDHPQERLVPTYARGEAVCGDGETVP